MRSSRTVGVLFVDRSILPNACVQTGLCGRGGQEGVSTPKSHEETPRAASTPPPPPPPVACLAADAWGNLRRLRDLVNGGGGRLTERLRNSSARGYFINPGRFRHPRGEEKNNRGQDIIIGLFNRNHKRYDIRVYYISSSGSTDVDDFGFFFLFFYFDDVFLSKNVIPCHTRF